MLMMMGYSYNTDDASELDKARKFLIDLKPFVHSIDSVNLKQKIIGGKAYGGMAGTATAPSSSAREARPSTSSPSEGGEFWIDAYVIPIGAKNPDAAHKWIDFVLPAEGQRAGDVVHVLRLAGQADAPAGRSGEEHPQQHRRVPAAEPRQEARAEQRLARRGRGLRERIWTEFKSA